MKKVVFPAFLLLFLLSCFSAWGKACSMCGTNLPGHAKFCLSCGQRFPVAKGQTSTKGDNEALFRNFAPVDDFEKSIGTGVYSTIVGGYPQFKITFGNALKRFNAARSKLPEALQLLGELYLEKARACESVVNAMTATRMDSPYRKALLIYFGNILDWYNRVLKKARKLKTFTPEDFANLKAEAANITIRAQRFEITAPYLKLGRTKVPRGAAFAILDVRKHDALVLVLAETPTDEHVQRWEPLSSLLERTTWVSNNEAVYTHFPFSKWEIPE